MIDRHAFQRRPRRQAHIGLRLLPSRAPAGARSICRIGHMAPNPHCMLRAGAPGDLRLDLGRIYGDLADEPRIPPARQGPPMGQRGIPIGALRCEAAAVDIVVGRVIGRDQPDLGAEFDRHIADGEPPLDGHRADRRARIFHSVAITARRADKADQVQDHVLRGHASRQCSLETDPHRVGPLLDDGLGCQDVCDFA